MILYCVRRLRESGFGILQLIDVQDRLVAGVGDLLGEAVRKIEPRDTIAVQGSDFPHDLVPHVVLQNNRFVAALVVPVRQFVGAVIVKGQG